LKKINCLRSVISALGLLLLFPAQTFAGGGISSNLELTTSASSVTVGNSVTLSLYAYEYACNEDGGIGVNTHSFTCTDGSQSYKYPTSSYFWVTVTGSGNTTSGLAKDGGHDAIQTGADGRGSFTLSSTAAEAKSITVTNQSGYNPELNQTVTVTFKSPPVAAAPKPAPVASTPMPTPEPTPPEAPKTTTLEVNGQTLATAGSDLKVTQNQPFVLKGTTVANGVVKFYIFSTPREATVTADATGAWSYAVTGLEPGSHHVEAEVTDPTTNKTSTRSTLAAFTVVKAVAATVKSPAVTKSKPKGTPGWFWIVAGLAAVALIAGGWWFIRRRKQGNRSDTLTPIDSNTPPAPTPPTIA